MKKRKKKGRFWSSLFLAVFLALVPVGAAGAAPAPVGDDFPVRNAEVVESPDMSGETEEPPAEEEAEEPPAGSGQAGEETAANPEQDLAEEETALQGEEENLPAWYRSAEARGVYDFTRGRGMIGTYYLGESLAEIFAMIEDPALPDFDLDTYFRHTVFAGMTREELESWQAAGFLTPEDILPYMPAALLGETNPVVAVRNYSSAVGTSEAFHVQNYPLNGSYAVCVQKGAPIKSGCVYTRMSESEGDTPFYCREAERILGYGDGQQKAMSRLLSLVNNPDRDAVFPGLPEHYWVFFAQAASWSLLDPDKGAACVESDAYFASEISGILRWADFVNDDISYIAGGRDWGSVECVGEILAWLKTWTEENGYARLYWYYVPGTEYQALCVPDLDSRVRESGYLELNKSGVHTGPEANVAGVVYGIYRDEACTDLAGTITTDENGGGRSEALPAGTYYVREREAGTGLCLDPTVYPVEVRPDGAARSDSRYSVTDEEWQGEIRVRKASPEGESLPGAVFTLYEYSQGSGAYRVLGSLTDQGDGTYVSPRLYYTAENQGRFRVEETQAPAGYLNGNWAEDFVLTKEEEIFVREVENRPTRYRFFKTDTDGAPVAGCRFRLLTEDGEVVAEWVTDETGLWEISGMLEVGKTYLLQEIEVPVGYRPAAEQTFTVEASEETITIRTENSEIPAVIRVRKTDEEEHPLPGAVFGLYSTYETEGERLVWEGKTYYYQTRKTAGADGQAVFDGLRTTRGEEYLLVEFSTASGYERLGEPVSVGVLPEMSRQEPADSYGGEVQEKDGCYYLYEKDYTIVNRPGYTLPLAGGSAGAVCWPAFWLTGAAALVCAWAEGIRRRNG